MNTKKQNYTLPIVMMFALFAMIAFVTNLCSPMAVIVKNQFGASNFAAQLGNAANFIAYAVMGIPSGLLLEKIGYKKTALLAIVIGFVGVFLQYMSGWDSIQSFWVYLIGAFVAGFCMCMLNSVVNPMLNTLGGGGNRGNQLIQFGGVLNSTSAVFVTILMGSLIGDAAKARFRRLLPRCSLPWLSLRWLSWCCSSPAFRNRLPRSSETNPTRKILTAHSLSGISVWVSWLSSCTWAWK